MSLSVIQGIIDTVREHGRIETRGRPNKLSVPEQVLLTIQYWRQYLPQHALGLIFGVSEATACRIIESVERALAKSGKYDLNKKNFMRRNAVMIKPS
jgi:hypothetical protein